MMQCGYCGASFSRHGLAKYCSHKCQRAAVVRRKPGNEKARLKTAVEGTHQARPPGSSVGDASFRV